MVGHIHDRTYYSGFRILSLLCWSRCIGWIVKKPQKTNATLAKKTSPQSHRRNHTFATHDTTHYIKAIANHSEWKRHYPANASYHVQAILRPCNTTLTSLSWSQTYSSLKNSLWAASLENHFLIFPLTSQSYFCFQHQLQCIVCEYLNRYPDDIERDSFVSK